MIKRLLLLVLLVSLLPALTYGDITTGLVGWWKFDEGSGTTPQDSSGNANHGTFVNAPTWVAGHIGSNALNFNGVNDKVDVGNGASLNPTTTMSLAAWVNTAAATTTQLILTKSVPDISTQYALSWRSTQRLRLAIFAGGSSTILESNTNKNGGTWYHVVGVYNGTDLRIYIDGSLDSTPGAKTGAMAADNGQTVLLGSSPNTAPQSFNGALDELRIYNRALSSTDVTELFNFTGAAAPPIARRPLWMQRVIPSPLQQGQQWGDTAPWISALRKGMKAYGVASSSLACLAHLHGCFSVRVLHPISPCYLACE